MRSTPQKPSPLTLHNLLPLAGAYGIFLLALSMDIVLLYDTGLLEEGPPRFDLIYQIRTALIAASGGLLVFGLSRDRQKGRDTGKVLEDKGQHLNSESVSHRNASISKKPSRMILWGLLGLSAGFVILFLFDPRAFYEFAREDNFIEVASAVAWFFSGLVFLRVAHLVYRSQSRPGSILVTFPLVLGLACFLVGMEEISWFQRVLSYKTPDLIKGNLQDEFNLHNFATDQVENAYYAGIFAYFILVPFLFRTLLRSISNPLISNFLPSLTVVFASSLAMAYNYDMWNILFTQFIFFTTFFILVAYTRQLARTRKFPILLIAFTASLILTQVTFLLKGDSFGRLWDVTEYKEFLIPLAVSLYALEVFRQFRGKNLGQEKLQLMGFAQAPKNLPLTDQPNEPS